MEGDPPEISIVLLGDAECGKSTFLSRLSHGRNTDFGPIEALAPTLHDLDQPFVYDVRLYNRPYRFLFSDTASPENWTLLRPDVVVLCYDISSRTSLENLQALWMKETIAHFMARREMPVVILGLKRDLREENDGVIYPQEAVRIAQEMRCDKYMECSAVTGELCREAFEDIAKTAAMTTTSSKGLTQASCTLM
ncbi:MAG: hypothetical protein M1824_006354 [Vezdaea acicularis]|nr:MAG: hypothetical protein M1824_006354 [Vezdaea acicularis]